MIASNEDNFEINFENEQSKFNGIIAHLRDANGKNPVLHGILEIISPTKTHPEYPLSHLVEYTNLLDKCYWNFACYNPKEEENWLLFNFKENHRVFITAYTIRSGGSSHPKSWRIEGSNDKHTWITIHQVKDCRILNSPRATHTFTAEESEIKSETKSGFQFIRFVQLENMSPKVERKFRINLKAIEFFGKYFTIAE